MADQIDESTLLKLYGLSTLDPQEWEEPSTSEDTQDDALDLALRVTQTPILGSGDGEGNGDRSMSRREMDDPLGLKRKLEIPRGADLKSHLQRGADNLRKNVEERGEEVRILVEREFGRFVAVKGSTDAAYRDMKTDLLAEGSDHGTREIRETIKAQKLKSTLGIFERSKFLFGLPRALRMSVRAGKYEAALREYNKGLYLMKNRPNQLLHISLPTSGVSNPLSSPVSTGPKHSDTSHPFASNDGSGTAASLLSPSGNTSASNNSLTDAQVHARREQQKRLLGKIWSEVEKVMAEMRTRLEDGLRGNLSLDENGAGTGAEDNWSGAQRTELSVEEVEKSIDLDTTTGTSEPSVPEFVPKDANSLVTCHYASKVLAEIVESTSEIDALTASSSAGTTTSADLGQETKKALKEFVESCRWRLEEAICGTWSQVAWQVAGGSIEYGADKGIVPAVFVNKIKGCFLDSLYYFLDGLVRLALSEEDPLLSEQLAQQTHINWRDKDTRILVTMSNIHYLRKELLPNMLQRFEALYGLKSVDDKKILQNIIEQVDDVLFQDYLKRKRETFQSITEAGLLGPSEDPLTNVRPKDVRPYMLKDLLYLVDAHAHVTNLAPALTQRVIETLVGELAHSLLQGFSQIRMMGIGAMLSATLEVEFLDRTVLPYVNQEAMNVLNQIYASVSQAYTAYKTSAEGTATGEDNLSGELEDLKKILLEARRATGVQFICFRQQKG
ncbi:hypothetical protein QFC19_006842 [Naganishia cerealis]|uniref:Uncharacterized protein n=1 Tax=Naganishia cerealis TaxID=610337 RepID=A0ACC2VDC6_9TREE|nr:hypothetical protein QFC19_006842 [Naganishia cerealis]